MSLGRHIRWIPFVLTIAAPYSALSESEFGCESEFLCFERSYTSEHLARHPEQRVTEMRLGFMDPMCAATTPDSVLLVHVFMRNGGGYASFICGHPGGEYMSCTDEFLDGDCDWPDAVYDRHVGSSGQGEFGRVDIDYAFDQATLTSLGFGLVTAEVWDRIRTGLTTRDSCHGAGYVNDEGTGRPVTYRLKRVDDTKCSHDWVLKGGAD